MTASAPVVMEVLSSAPRRRRWTDQEKQDLVAETFEPGMTVSRVARRRGVDPSLLFRWRRRLCRPAVAAAPLFAPVEVAEPAAELPAVAEAAGSGLIEIELTGRWRVRVDRHVDAAALRRVLDVLEAPR